MSALGFAPFSAADLASVSLSSIPALARGVRLATRGLDEPMLLSPERGARLNETAAATLALVDGRRSVLEIVASLRARYPAGGDVLDSDVVRFIEQLAAHFLVTLRQPPRSES